jgi:3-deoxy-D-manno-octulosonate 8-phosphate phosphatase (KDO 8-P phosphatase)
MNIPPSVIEKASHIKLLLLDVDGVLTDGKIYFTEDGNEHKAFHSQDGLGIKMLRQAGIEVGIVTARQSNIVQMRMNELGVKYVFQSQTNELNAYEKIKWQLSLKDQNISFVGDDLIDIASIKRAGFGVAVANAALFVKQHADWVTTCPGGFGAVREVCEFILLSQNKLSAIHEAYLMTPTLDPLRLKDNCEEI